MGGAERAERKRKQAAQAAAAQQKAVQGTKTGDGGTNRTVVAGVAVAVLLALVVGGGIWLQNRNDDSDLPAAIPVAQPSVDYPAQVRGNAVVTGDPDAPVTIDVYEDFLCPICGEFEEQYGPQLQQAAASGAATVIHHPVAILDDLSEPEGYSTLAAATALCAAESGIYPRVHASLFATQPEEGSAGWTRPQLVQLGRELGAGDEFATCLRDGGPDRIAAATVQAQQDAAGPRGFGTPTVLVNGEMADIGDSGWLDDALGTDGG